MPGHPRLIETLKRSLRARGLTYRDLARALDLSEPSVKRMFSRGTFTLARLEAVLAVLELDFYELARLARGAVGGPVELSLEQERALAADERLLSVFWLLQNGWPVEDILADFSIGRSALTLALGRLARLKLIDWGPRAASGSMGRTCTAVTRAAGGPRCAQSISAAIDSGDPAISASTLPSLRLRTQPSS